MRLADLDGDRKRSKDAQLLAVGLQGLEGADDLWILAVALEIDEEDVLRLGSLGRKRFDPGQVDLVRLEDVEHLGQRAGLMADAEHQGGLVIAGLGYLLVADDGDARLVV